MNDRKPPKDMRELMARKGIKPGASMLTHPKPQIDPDAPDQATMPVDLERAAQYLDEYAIMLSGQRRNAVSYLADKLRKRAKFRRALHGSLVELEHAAQAKAQGDDDGNENVG